MRSFEPCHRHKKPCDDLFFDTEMAEEEGIATAPSYTWYIMNFSKLTINKLYSDIFVADGYKWRLLVYPKGNGVKHLSLYLDVPDSSTLPDGWSRDVESFSITVVNQICPKDSIKKYIEHERFDAKESDKGFYKFIPLADIHGPAKGYLVADTLIVEVRVSDSVELSSNLLMRSSQSSSTLTTASRSSQSSSTLLEMSKNLLIELSSTNRMQRSTTYENSESNLPPNPQSLQQQRTALQDYLALSLEAIEQTNAFDEVERTALLLVQHSSNSLEKLILKDLVTRLATFKEMLPSTKSSIENAKAHRKSLSGKRTDIGARLDRGQEQLSSLKAKYSALSEEELGIKAEILRLTTQEEELLIRKNSVALELEKMNEQVSKDLGEWKDISKETEEADTHWLQTREKLAQANLSWKLFKQNLEQCKK